jgi:hypothetical protein
MTLETLLNLTNMLLANSSGQNKQTEFEHSQFTMAHSPS